MRGPLNRGPLKVPMTREPIAVGGGSTEGVYAKVSAPAKRVLGLSGT